MRRIPQRLCGEAFGEEGLRAAREVIERSHGCSRSEIARRVCEHLRWVNEAGRSKEVGARVALLALERAGWVELPRPRNGNGIGSPPRPPRHWPLATPLAGSVEEVRGLELERVSREASSVLWNALVDRYHYLRGWRLSGEQVRYLIVCQEGVLGAIGFGAAALKLSVRDRWIGWDREHRERQRQAVVNNRRFLILPWVRVRNLASRVLALGRRAMVRDYRELYGRRVVLLESFVEAGRFAGTSYRAANWLWVGRSAGRGRGDRQHRRELPLKDVYMYVVEPDFRRVLCGAGQ